MHSVAGIGLGVLFVVLLLGIVVGFATIATRLTVDMLDCSIGAFGAIALLLIAALVAIRIYG